MAQCMGSNAITTEAKFECIAEQSLHTIQVEVPKLTCVGIA